MLNSPKPTYFQPSIFSSSSTENTPLIAPPASTGEETISIVGMDSRNPNVVDGADRAFHDWYRFVLSYPPHLVRHYLDEFGVRPEDTVLDPFSGTGTTVLEARINGFAGVGLEANPFPFFAGAVKNNWTVNPEALVDAAVVIANQTHSALASQGIIDNGFGPSVDGSVLRDLPPESKKLLIRDSISPLPLHKTLVLLDEIRKHASEPYYEHLLLASGNVLVTKTSNLRFGPEVGIGKLKHDVPVVPWWLNQVERMATDLKTKYGFPNPPATLIQADAREISTVLTPNSVGAVITSPPYPNEKDYTRITRLESVLLGFYDTKDELQGFKKQLVRSNTRGIYKADDDDKWVSGNERIQQIVSDIESRRIELGKTSGFERLYGRLTQLYFGGMAKHLAQLRYVLRPGAYLAYVVGDQASYLRVMIRTGQILGDIARSLGYELVRIDLFRSRFATGTQTELREEVLILRWPA